jgi:hypothetical protein
MDEEIAPAEITNEPFNSTLSPTAETSIKKDIHMDAGSVLGAVLDFDCDKIEGWQRWQGDGTFQSWRQATQQDVNSNEGADIWTGCDHRLLINL